MTRPKTNTVTTTTHLIADGLYLVGHDLTAPGAAPAVSTPAPTHHVVVIDCSGSMTEDLPKIRAQLRGRLPSLLQEEDVITIVWFSGCGQCGVLGTPGARVRDLPALENLNRAIDRWLRPVGLTGFVEPFQQAVKAVRDVAQANPSHRPALLFMSDGGDNQWTRPQIIDAVEQAAGVFSCATVVEYGWYCDRPLMTAIAEKLGGALIFADGFDAYQPSFEGAMRKRGAGWKKRVTLDKAPLGSFVFALHGGDMLTFAVGEDDMIDVPADIETVWFLASGVGAAIGAPLSTHADMMAHGKAGKTPDSCIDAAYAAVSLYAQRVRPDIVLPLLAALGDVSFIDEFSGLFGKQRYSAFCARATAAAFGDGRFLAGWDPKRVPRDDAYTLLDLLEDLRSDDLNRLRLDDPAFKYQRIGRRREDVSARLTADEEKALIDQCTVMLGDVTIERARELQASLGEILAGKGKPLVFVPDDAPDGLEVTGLVYTEDRSNISVRVRREGYVDITQRVDAAIDAARKRGDDAAVGALTSLYGDGQVRTFIWRNYAIIRDGLVNVATLPLRVTPPTFAKLAAAGLVTGAYTPDVVVDVSKLPIVNRRMVSQVSAKALFEKKYQLLQAQAAQKVYGDELDRRFPQPRAAGLAETYGAEAAAWLAEQGITDGGFNPRVAVGQATDKIATKLFEVKLAGFSSLPKVSEARERMAPPAKGAKPKKLTPSAELLVPHLQSIDEFLASPAYKAAESAGAATAGKVLEAWLKQQAAEATARTRALLGEIARIKFAVVVGQVWFTEFASLDETTLTLPLHNGAPVVCEARLTEKEESI